jgi:GGDEF domain-containing protein
VRDAANVERVGEGILAALSEDFAIGKRQITIGVTIGWVLYPPDARDASAMLRRADEALYAAKRAGKGRMQRWHEHLSAASHAAAEAPAPG